MNIRTFLLWPGFVFVIGLASLIGAAALVYHAHSDPSFAVEPGYYQKALRWDEQSAQMRRSQALGWSVRAESGPDGSARDRFVLAIRLADAEGQPIEGASVRCIVFANSRAAERLESDAVEAAPGTYEGRVVMPHPGSWMIRVTADKGEDHFVAEIEHSPARLPSAGGQP